FADTSNQLPSTLRIFGKYLRLKRKLGHSAGAPTLLLSAPSLPALTNSWGAMASAVSSTWFGRTEVAIKHVERAIRHHPEGFFYYLHGSLVMLLPAKNRTGLLGNARRAEQSFRNAIEATWAVPLLARTARFSAAYLQTIFGRPGPGRAADPVMKTRALGNIRWLLQRGNLTPHEWDMLAGFATDLNEYDLARMLVRDWEAASKNDLNVLRRRAAVELKAGAYGAALEAAKKVLARKPGDKDALRSLKEASEKLKAQAEGEKKPAFDRTTPKGK